ncbi:mitochondrial 3-hydroxyisobutyryl-CoA hydrolase [Pyronema domesticum]|nr:mitochondrial 3-hydroxyisobutyryl-CoA hydrolase [Pyronema domesticum]
MPLRAKIVAPGFRAYSSQMDPDDVLFQSNYGVRTIELNRPAKYNALNGSMISKIRPRLQEWEKSQLANIIVVKGAGEKAFCAGGDVTTLAINNKEGRNQESVDFFRDEYQVNHLIATYSKPYVAFMDGITMGGGVGLSVHAPFRIATERTVFAMPETTIGFFPDVGGSFFLPRLDGEIGTYLALTSQTLQGVNALYAGIATHYLHSSSLPDLEARLAELDFPDSLPLADRENIINETIDEYSTGLPSDSIALGGSLRASIDRCFSADSIEGILLALSTETANKAWAEQTTKTIRARSPTSLRVTLKQLRLGKNWTIGKTFQWEHQIATRFMYHPDFVEGVDKRLISKTNDPVWTPEKLEDAPESIVEEFFDIPAGTERLKLLKEGAAEYRKYPHARFGLPTEEKVRSVVNQARLPAREIVEWFVREYKGKDGVREKVKEVLERKTKKDEAGVAVWNVL